MGKPLRFSEFIKPKGVVIGEEQFEKKLRELKKQERPPRDLLENNLLEQYRKERERVIALNKKAIEEGR